MPLSVYNEVQNIVPSLSIYLLDGRRAINWRMHRNQVSLVIGGKNGYVALFVDPFYCVRFCNIGYLKLASQFVYYLLRDTSVTVFVPFQQRVEGRVKIDNVYMCSIGNKKFNELLAHHACDVGGIPDKRFLFAHQLPCLLFCRIYYVSLVIFG